MDALRTVARETPRTLAIDETLCPEARKRRAIAFCSAVRAGGLPICEPLALATRRPALVRSDISTRSYSANEAAI